MVGIFLQNSGTWKKFQFRIEHYQVFVSANTIKIRSEEPLSSIKVSP